MFFNEEDKRTAEELYNNFPTFDIRVGMDKTDFYEGNIHTRQWQVHAPSKNKTWYTGCGTTFIDAYKNLVERLEEAHDRI